MVPQHTLFLMAFKNSRISSLQKCDGLPAHLFFMASVLLESAHLSPSVIFIFSISSSSRVLLPFSSRMPNSCHHFHVTLLFCIRDLSRYAESRDGRQDILYIIYRNLCLYYISFCIFSFSILICIFCKNLSQLCEANCTSFVPCAHF